MSFEFEKTPLITFHMKMSYMQFHFHKNGFALRLALKERNKGTRKSPITLTPRLHVKPLTTAILAILHISVREGEHRWLIFRISI